MQSSSGIMGALLLPLILTGEGGTSREQYRVGGLEALSGLTHPSPALVDPLHQVDRGGGLDLDLLNRTPPGAIEQLAGSGQAHAHVAAPHFATHDRDDDPEGLLGGRIRELGLPGQSDCTDGPSREHVSRAARPSGPGPPAASGSHGPCGSHGAVRA